MCKCKSDCIGIAAAASIAIGIIAAILRYTAIITVTPAFLWVTFGIAVVYLAVTLITSAVVGEANGCICSVFPVAATGILGTILTSIVLLGISFAATSVVGAVITGALLLFLSLIITSVVCLIKCILGCNQDF